MLKYVPRMGAWGEADICQVGFTPALTPDLTVESRKEAEGASSSITPRGRDLPPMSDVTDPPVLSSRGGSITMTRGGKSYCDQQILI